MVVGVVGGELWDADGVGVLLEREKGVVLYGKDVVLCNILYLRISRLSSVKVY